MSEIPLKPLGRQDIHRLETYLLLGTLLRKDVIERIRKAEDRLTWIDSLAVAAGALARQKAGMPISKIAEELGRSEGTIRNHLNKKTEAGKLVWETYELLAKGQVDPIATVLSTGDIEKVKKELDEAIKERDQLRSKVKELEDQVKELRNKLERIKTLLKEVAEVVSSKLEEAIKAI